jgi:SAM-dependent methyltransferase
MNCNLCGTPLSDKIYDSGDALSLTSLCTVHDGRTEVYVCGCCAHVQSAAMADIDAYYDDSYDILVDSEEEDQIYEVVAGRKVYRTEHQVKVLRDKLALTTGTRILDYGCAKSATLRTLASQIPGLEVHLFDVSDRYRPFWDKFIPRERGATFELPADWQDRFDVVTSFFSLEHMAQPQDALRKIATLLKTGGTFYGIVPNVLSNTADLIVVDHVNHFTPPSLAWLLRANGFEVQDISASVHRGALVFVARKLAQAAGAQPAAQDEVQAIVDRARHIADFWQQAGARVQAFEQTLGADAPVALYGAGFYGAFIASWLRQPQRIRYVIDQNAFLQGRHLHGAPVIAPADLPSDISTLLVGLNPAHARQIVGDIPAFAGRSLNCFYL